MEAYEKFKAFDFTDNQSWIQYYNGLEPTPPLRMVDKFKRKWYQRNIDKNFDINFNPSEQSSNQSNQQQYSQQQSGSYTNPYQQYFNQQVFNTLPRWFNKILDFLRIFCYQMMFIVYALSVFEVQTQNEQINQVIEFLKFRHMWFALFASLVGIVRLRGFVKFSKNYWACVLQDEDFQQIFYIFMFIWLETGLVQLVPLLIPTIVSLEVILPGFLARKISDQKYLMGLLKSELEIFLGFLLLVGWASNTYSFIIVLLYWQVIRTKYFLNTNYQTIFGSIRQAGDKIFARPRILQIIWEKFRNFIIWMNQMQTGQAGGGGGGGGCNIL